jgi:hypothetical protein
MRAAILAFSMSVLAQPPTSDDYKVMMLEHFEACHYGEGATGVYAVGLSQSSILRARAARLDRCEAVNGKLRVLGIHGPAEVYPH